MKQYKHFSQPVDPLEYEGCLHKIAGGSQVPFDFKIPEKYQGQKINVSDAHDKKEKLWAVDIPANAAYVNVDEMDKSKFMIIYYSEARGCIKTEEMRGTTGEKFRALLRNRLESLTD